MLSYYNATGVPRTVGTMEVCTLLRVSKTTIRRWRQQGILGGYFLPASPGGIRVWRIDRDELVQFAVDHSLPLRELAGYADELTAGPKRPAIARTPGAALTGRLG